MHTIKIILALMVALGAVVNITQIGKKRLPLEAKVVAVSTFVNAIMVYALLS